MGRSLGSASVIELAKRFPKDFNGIIIESGFADEQPILRLLNINHTQTNLDKSDGFFNNEKIQIYKGPLLIIHANEDHIIPFKQAEILFSSCISKIKKLVSISYADHNNILTINPKKYFYEIVLFINNNL